MTVNTGKEFPDEQLDKVSGGFDKKTVVFYRFKAGDAFEVDSFRNLLVVTKDTNDQIREYDCIIVQEYRAKGHGYVKGNTYPINVGKLIELKYMGKGFKFTIVE